MPAPPVPPHRVVGNVGLVDDHNALVDVATDAQTRIATNESNISLKANITALAGYGQVAIVTGGWKITMGAGRTLWLTSIDPGLLATDGDVWINTA